jgi:hypothetical protein
VRVARGGAASAVGFAECEGSPFGGRTESGAVVTFSRLRRFFISPHRGVAMSKGKALHIIEEAIEGLLNTKGAAEFLHVKPARPPYRCEMCTLAVSLALEASP